MNDRLFAAPMEREGPPSPLRELTAGLARGDDEAWAAFHREYGPGIYHRLLAATRGDRALADEALQQTYLRVARHARPCDSAPMFASWLRAVARSALSDCRRRQRSFWGLIRRRSDEGDGLVDSSGEDRLSEALDSALAGLDPEDRSLLESKYFAGRDVRSLAAALDISPKAAESRLTRARAELRRLMEAALLRHE